MSKEQLLDAYLQGQISRRTFVRRLVAAGVSLTAAATYARLLNPDPAEAYTVDELEDLYHEFYPPPPPPPQPQPPPQPVQPAAPPDRSAPSTTLRLLGRSLGAILRVGKIVISFTMSEPGSASFIVVVVVAGRAGAARSVTVAKGSAVYPTPGTRRVPLKLTRKGRRALRRRRRARAAIISRARDRAGNTNIQKQDVTLRR